MRSFANLSRMSLVILIELHRKRAQRSRTVAGQHSLIASPLLAHRQRRGVLHVLDDVLPHFRLHADGVAPKWRPGARFTTRSSTTAYSLLTRPGWLGNQPRAALSRKI